MSEKKGNDTTSENQEPMKPAWKENLDRAREKSQAAQEAEKKLAPLKPPQEHKPKLKQGVLPGVPFTPKDTAPMSNHLARSPLFAPIKRGRRAMHDKTRLPSPEGCSIHFTGKQLDMADQDVFLVALQLARGQEPDKSIIINRSDFLKLCGFKSIGKSSYDWLRSSFKRLSKGSIDIETDRIDASLPLMGPLIYDKISMNWTFSIPKETLSLFITQEYGYIELEKRRMLVKQVDLAKWLQSYIVSHAAGEHKASVELLKKLSGYEGRLRDFRNYLESALSELVRVRVLKEWSFYERKKKVKLIR